MDKELFFTCPTTGEIFRVDTTEIGSAVGINVIKNCIMCGREHTWTDKDVFYFDDEKKRVPFVKE